MFLKTGAQMFHCKICKVFKNNSLAEHRVAAYVKILKPKFYLSLDSNFFNHLVYCAKEKTPEIYLFSNNRN